MADGDIPHDPDSVQRVFRLLPGPHAGITPQGLQRMHMQMELGCDTCGFYSPGQELTCRLVQRRVSTYWTVYLQCQGCGRALGGALSRADHPGSYRYPEWDKGLVQRAEREREARWSQIQQERAGDVQKRRDEYSEWLLHSPEWYVLRRRVLKRANFICEACLAARADHVHHVTYKMGKLPPAWMLRAVCETCHQDIHEGWRAE